MTTIYNPSELGCIDSKTVNCPECGLESFVQHARYISGKEIKCVTSCCSHVFHLKVPDNLKQLVYLDQWFVSGLFAKRIDSEKKETYERILRKLLDLKQCEKVAVVVSYLNFAETAAMENRDHRDPTWQLFNQLSADTLTRNELDTVISQHVRAIVNPESDLHWSDILKESPHKPRIPSVVVLTREPLKKLLQIEISNAPNFNDAAREIIRDQLDQLPDNANLSTCHELMMRLTIGDLLDGCNFDDTSTNGRGCLKHYRYVLPLVNALAAASMSDTEALEAIASGGNPRLPPSTQLSIALESINLHKAQVSVRQTGGLTGNERKFSQNYGKSRIQDYSHISTYALYVNYILTDNAVANILNGDQLKSLDQELACEVFSDQNIGDFENILDDLVAKEESEDNLILRRILSGFSAQEQIDKLQQVLKESVRQKLEDMGYETKV